MTRTICILYGLNEGPAIGASFEAACQAAGFTPVPDPTKADIIFAHSGGCLLVPPINQARAVIQVGIPYWPGRPWLAATTVKVKWELASFYQQHILWRWPLKVLHHARYALKLRTGLRMFRNLGLNNPWNSAQHQYIIRNRYDAYCCPEIIAAAFKGPRTFIALPGYHDDCWEHPERYIDLLQLVA